MLESLELKNFKSFLNQRFEFKPLTILAGINASGKSSVVEAIDFLYYHKKKIDKDSDGNWRTDPFDELWKSDRYDALRSKLSRQNFFSVLAEWNHLPLSLKIDYSKNLPTVSTIEFVLEKNDLQLLTASRIGPQEYYKLDPQSKDASLDRNGQYVIDYILKLDENNTQINDKLKYGDSISFKDNLSDWLQIISPNANLTIDITNDRKYAKPYYNGIEATATGFGISYSLPIIATLLDPNIKLLAVDTPEAHLHPKGQSELCKLIARAVASGKQVVLETHSDHIIDGIRVAIKQNLINCNDAIIYFLERNADEPSKVTKIFFDSFGNLSNWPEEFFDQSLIDAGELL